MQAAATVGLSLVTGKEIHSHIEDIAFCEGRHTSLIRRVMTQATVGLAAYATLESVGFVKQGGRLSGVVGLLPISFLLFEGALSLLSRTSFGQSRKVCELINGIRAYLPRMITGILIASVVASTLIQPLMGLGLALHGFTTIAERIGWVSPRTVSVLALASTVAGITLGFTLGSAAVQAILVMEILSFLISRWPSATRRLGLEKPQGLSGNSPAGQPLLEQAGAAGGAAVRSQSIIPEMKNSVRMTSQVLATPAPSIWRLDGETSPPSSWKAQMAEITRTLRPLQQLADTWQERATVLQSLLEKFHALQSYHAMSIDELRGGLPLGILTRQQETYLSGLQAFREELQRIPAGAAGYLTYTEEALQEHCRVIQRAFTEQDIAVLEPVQVFMDGVRIEMMRALDVGHSGWLRQELEQVGKELPVHSRGVVYALCAQLERLNARFIQGNFGPGSLTNRVRAQHGWARCLEALHHLIIQNPSAERKELALRAVAQLVPACDSCSAATLRAIQDCHDMVIGVDQLKEGFLGWLNSVRSEEAALWQRNAFLQGPRRILAALADRGIPATHTIGALIGRPNVERALTGIEILPWLNTSYAGSEALVRRSQLADWESLGLGSQLAMSSMRRQIEERLSSVEVVIAQAVHYLTSPEGRVAWHHALAKPEFRRWVEDQHVGLTPEELAIAPAERMESFDPRTQSPFGTQDNNALPGNLWAAAFLLLRYSGCIDEQTARAPS